MDPRRSTAELRQEIARLDREILERLEAANEYCETSEARQLRKDAAAEIRELRHKTQQLEALIQRRASKSMARGVLA